MVEQKRVPFDIRLVSLGKNTLDLVEGPNFEHLFKLVLISNLILEELNFLRDTIRVIFLLKRVLQLLVEEIIQRELFWGLRLLVGRDLGFDHRHFEVVLARETTEKI